MDPIGLLVTGGGALLVAAALFEWSWFMNHKKARRLTNLVGRGAARAIYMVIGAVARSRPASINGLSPRITVAG